MSLKNLYLICGESGAGKTIVTNELAGKYGYQVLPSYTTRPPRHEGDTDHLFVSKEEYDKLPYKVATTYFDGNYYCCTAGQIETADLYVVDKEGILTLQRNYKGNRPLKVIYLTTAPFVRIQRMMNRGDSAEKAMERIQHDKDAFRDIRKLANHTVDTRVQLKDVVSQVYRIIQEEERKVEDSEDYQCGKSE